MSEDPRKCGHYYVRETVHVQETPMRYEYRCADCESALVVDPDEYARCQAGEIEGFTVTEAASGAVSAGPATELTGEDFGDGRVRDAGHFSDGAK